MARQSKDLFDDSTMTFGEHLEALRYHLFMALIGLILAVGVCLYYGEAIVRFVREPINAALQDYSRTQQDERIKVMDDVQNLSQEEWYEELGDWFQRLWSGAPEEPDEPEPEEETDAPTARSSALRIAVTAYDLLNALHEALPETHPEPPESARDREVSLTLNAPEFSQFRAAANQTLEPVTFNVQEAFMTYLKVSLIAGIVLASPWIFYQLWLFVAAGLYQHERKFVYIYGTMSLFLFIVGCAFCFYAVFPLVLKFLLSINARLGVTPQIRLSEWISFAVVLPLMFGISFQLPLVMRFLTAISIFDVEVYRTKRRLAILVIAFLSMVLTPAEPASMVMMMIPLIFLYELGIVLCSYSARRNPFEGQEA